jgi:hypothetical protein
MTSEMNADTTVLPSAPYNWYFAFDHSPDLSFSCSGASWVC